ncbi:uncharacterized protein LOC122549101 isoform X1 [Chiloscyllium plagiosum]|uniref:uncharacterized protein LOC122549101 isoform X1 n=2 Tax=Chiloscyllium plagiosum TaxID=36176 RepID=UPI001CB7DAFE|nr:uncharacterized protein LOC122549101 isoform X1 [Chiloscyllium plagiosum]
MVDLGWYTDDFTRINIFLRYVFIDWQKMDEQQSPSDSLELPLITRSEKFVTARQFKIPTPIKSKNVYFYKSGDPQFSGIRISINRRTFKTFDSLLDNLSEKIPLPFGVRTISTPRGNNSVTSLSDLKDGQAYICSDQRKVKPINLELANQKHKPWFISKPFNPEQLASRQIRQKAFKSLHGDLTSSTGIPKKLVIFRNGDPTFKRNLVLNRNKVQNFDVLLYHISELMNFPVQKLYSTDGKQIDSLYPVKFKLEAVVAVGREGYKLRKYVDSKFPQISNRDQLKNFKKAGKYHKIKSGRRQWKINSVSPSSTNSELYSTSSGNLYMNDNKNFLVNSFSLPENETCCDNSCIYTREDRFVIPSEDDIEKLIYMNEDGSMTVEMRVHLQIKESETVQWTTTINRSDVCKETNDTCNSQQESDVESTNLISVHCHRNPKSMHFEKMDHEQELDDLCIPQKGTIHTEQDNAEHYDISQSNSLYTKENLPKLEMELEPLYCYKRNPDPGKIMQNERTLKSMTVSPDTKTTVNIITLPSLEESGLGESIIEHCCERFPMSKSIESWKRNNYVISDDLQAWEENNVNAQAEEKNTFDKSTYFVLKNSTSMSSRPYYEDQLTVMKTNPNTEHMNTTNVFPHYLEEIGCGNFVKLNLRPNSADPIYSISKQVKKDLRRPMSALFTYSRSSSSIHNETSGLSSRLVCSDTFTGRKQKTDVNTSCSCSSEICEARMCCFLEDSKYSQSSAIRNQECIKSAEVELPVNTDLNDSLSTNEEERAFCRTDKTNPVINDTVTMCCRIYEQKTRNHTSENAKLHLEYSSYSQEAQVLDELAKPDILSDHQELLVIDADRHQTSDLNPVEMSNESKVTFHIEIGSDSYVSHKSTRLIQPEEINSNVLSIICPPDKGRSSTELLDNKLQRMGYQDISTINNNNSSVISSPEVNAFQDDFSSIRACEKEFYQFHEEGVQCSVVTTGENSNLPRRSSLKTSLDSDSPPGGNKKQISNINSSSTENNIQKSCSNTSRKKWKNQAKEKRKTFQVENFKCDVETSVQSFPTLQQKGQKPHDISQHQNLGQNGEGRMSPTSNMVCYDLNLRPTPLTQFEEEQPIDNLTSDFREAFELPDSDYDFINQIKKFKSETKEPDEHKLIQLSAKVVNEAHEMPDDCINDHSSQCRVTASKGRIRFAANSNENPCSTIMKMTDNKLNIIDFAKDKNDIAIQTDVGLVSEIAEEKGSIGELNLSEVLCKLQSMVDMIKAISQQSYKTRSAKTNEIPDISEHLAATLSTSSKVLLAWFAIMNLNVNIPVSPDSEKLVMNNCNYLEVIRFLQSVKRIIKFQETADLKRTISNLHKCDSQFIKVQKNKHEEFGYDFENNTNTKCHLWSATSGAEQTASFGGLQQINVVESVKCLHTQNIIAQLGHAEEVEAKEGVNNNANILSSKGRTKESDKMQETGDKVSELFSTRGHLISSDILKDQIIIDSLFQNEGIFKDEKGINKEWIEREIAKRTNPTEGCDPTEEIGSLQHTEEIRREGIAEDKEFFHDNNINNNEHKHSENQRDNETNYHLTCNNGIKNTNELLTASDAPYIQNKISFQSLMHKSLLTNDGCRLKQRDDFCQRDHMSNSYSCEIPAYRLSTSAVVSNIGFENGSKTDNNQLIQTKVICDNTFIESEIDNQELLPFTFPTRPLNHVEKHLERQQTSDLSEENPESANDIPSDYNSQASNEMTTEGEEDMFLKTKHFSTTFVRQATERMYSKSHVSKCISHDQSSNLCAETETIFHSGKINDIRDGLYIEKGRWLLKENHLIRKSPPLNMGMYGNLSSTTFDNTSVDSAHPQVSTMHSGFVLTELSSTEIEERTTSRPMCRYFNMLHGSDSEPFPELNCQKNKYRNMSGGSHIAKRNENIKQSPEVCIGTTQMYGEISDNDSSFSSVAFRMFDNKVGPLAQPLCQEKVIEQPSKETARALQNPDSLDKVHFLCGQHCPILTAVIDLTSEESRRFVYQKKSDVENLWIHFEDENDIFNIKKSNGLTPGSEKFSIFNKNLTDIISEISMFKTQSIENDIKKIKLRLDTNYLSANLKKLKVPLHTEETELKNNDKALHIQAKKLYIRRIVQWWFLKKVLEDNLKDKVRNISLSDQAQ